MNIKATRNTVLQCYMFISCVPLFAFLHKAFVLLFYLVPSIKSVQRLEYCHCIASFPFCIRVR